MQKNASNVPVSVMEYDDNKYDLSVIIPAYNAEKYIERAILSVFSGKSGHKIEVVVVDDYSSDNTVGVVQNIQHSFPDLYLQQQKENRGAGVCRNIGMSCAQGRYLAFLDADDYYLDGAIDKLADRASDTEVDVLLFKYKVSDESGNFANNLMARDGLAWERYDVFQQQVSSLSDAPYLLGLAGYPWNKLISRAYAEKINLRFSATYVLNDVYAHWQALLFSKKIMVFNQPVVCHIYETNRSQLTNLNDDRKVHSLTVLDEVRSLFDKFTELESYIHWFYSFEDDLINWMYRSANINNKRRLADFYLDRLASRVKKIPSVIGKKVIIFGVGWTAISHYDIVSAHNNVVGFMDNTLSRAGYSFMGKPIYNPAAKNLPDYDCIIICSEFVDDIVDSLDSFGLKNYITINEIYCN
mgnify:CR=1 FL=1